MAVDLWPYSARQAGKVNDLEHEVLWSAHYDGILPDQAPGAGAVAVNTSTRVWSVQPADILIRGHVLRVDTAQSATLATNAGAARVDVLVAFVNRTTNPWTWGVAVRQGVSGGGRPALTRDPAGLWEVALADMQVLSSGAASMLVEHRPSTRPGAQFYGPGAPESKTGTNIEQVVNSLTVPAAGWDRIVHVTAGCYIRATQAADQHDLTIYRGGVQVSAGGQWRGTGDKEIDTASVSCTPFLLAAGVEAVLQLRARRTTGVGTWQTSADDNLNHLDVLAVPA